MEDVEIQITRLEQLLADARTVPLSSAVMVPRQELAEALSRLRDALPEELRQARWIIKERDELLQQAEREAEQLRADGRAEQRRLVEASEVLQVARREAERIVEEARAAARALRLESEDYVDAKLADFESVLQRTLASVAKGRQRLRDGIDAASQAERSGTADPHHGVEEAHAAGDGAAPRPARAAMLFDHERGAG